MAGRVVARVLGSEELVVPWIRGSAASPSHGRSCEHFDDPTERRGRKGECQVFARSGFKSNWHFVFDSPKKNHPNIVGIYKDFDSPLE